MAVDIGRVCVKIAGREAGRYCVIVEALDKNFVLIDGQVRRKKCNINHLEPLEQTVEIKKGASHADVVKALEKLNIAVTATKPRTKKGPKPIAQRKKKEKPAPAQKPKEAPEKKEKTGKKEKQGKKKEEKKK